MKTNIYLLLRTLLGLALIFGCSSGAIRPSHSYATFGILLCALCVGAVAGLTIAMVGITRSQDEQ